jgi:ABC-type sugar transport system ATPase subunit
MIPKLQTQGISKTFPGVRALQDVSFALAEGEVVGLVGVNGAGKSTLMSILGGIHQPDQGQILIDGQPVTLHSPKDAERRGISFIHQELLFFASQTVAENIYISHMMMSKRIPFVVDRRAANVAAKKYLAMLGSTISPTTRMENLSVGARQVVEVARALALGSDIVIFDEPTSSLSITEKNALFAVIRRLKSEGKAIIYITHFLDEILDLCDKYVVLRNGQIHGQGDIGGVTTTDLVKMIVGKDIKRDGKDEAPVAQRPALKVENLSSRGRLNDVSFQLNEGEIVGLWGLMGSGRTELVRAILGLDPISSGSVYLFDSGRPIKTPPRRLLRRCGYLTESRHTDGLFLKQSVWKNISATALSRYSSRAFGLMRTTKEIATANHYISLLKIATPGPDTGVESLSGGSQQKVILAKWLNRNPTIMMMDEPTRGVDIGAKLEIGSLIRQLASSGTSIFLITSELEEMINLSHRVLVLRNGAIAGEVRGEQINNANLTAMSLGESRDNG